MPISIPGAMIGPLAGDDVKGDRRSEVDDDKRLSVLFDAGNGVEQAVGAEPGRVFHLYFEAGVKFSGDPYTFQAEVFAHSLAEHLVKGGNDAAEYRAVDIAFGYPGGRQQPEDHKTDLVRGLLL